MSDRLLSLSELAEGLGRSRLVGDPAARVTRVVYDSRATERGDLFVALRGADVDGHAFCREAVERGAGSCLVERDTGVDVPQLIVPDSRAALAAVAATFYGHPSRELGVIGITGTDGKTTTSFLIDAILRGAGLTTGLIGTVEIRVGNRSDTHETRQTTPESIDIQRYLREMVEAGASWATVEATSHGLAMHRLDGVAFAIGAVTNVTREHLDFHGTVEAYQQAKGLLFERVGEAGGTAVINADDSGAALMAAYAGGSKVLRYSAEGRSADVRAVDVVLDRRGSAFAVETDEWGEARAEVPLIGGFNVANALCALSAGLAAGIGLETAVAALAAAPQVPGRMAGVDAGQPFAIVVDYAHTPDALAKVLSLLRGLHPRGHLIVVFGSAGERDVEKRPKQGAIAARYADYAVFTSEDPRNEDADAIIEEIAAGAVRAGAIEGTSFARITDRREAVRHALSIASANDCVLLAGKGHEGSIIWGREKRPWDEEGVARELLAELGFGAKVGEG
jgi:UDP-N-acetylmuramoyl-L-alanyl-D-glutamate--2,6-diaminopimelate ligase